MPYSDGSLRPWIAQTLRGELAFSSAIVRVVDIGAGAGANRDALAGIHPHMHWTAVEIWEPYVERFHLTERYDDIIIGDVREVTLPNAYLYILGDVLEHMPQKDAIELWNTARERASVVVASFPIIHWEQGAEEGNPYEAHVHHWSVKEALELLPGISEYRATEQIGAFIARVN